MSLWRLDGAGVSLVLASAAGRLPEVVYWGPPLPAGEDLAAVANAGRGDVTGGMLDALPPLSICPEAERSFPGQPGMTLRNASGARMRPAFRFTGAEEAPGRLVLTYRDGGLTYRATYQVDMATGVIAAFAALESDAPVWLDWLAAPVFPGPQLADEMLDFGGPLVWRVSGAAQPVVRRYPCCAKPTRPQRA